MPIVKDYQFQKMPKWAGLKKYLRKDLLPDETVEICEKEYPKVALMPISGTITVIEDEKETVCEVGHAYEPAKNCFQVRGFPYYYVEKASFILMCGDWRKVDISIFRVGQYDHPQNPGTPAPYYRNTGFDNHYHDFDEFWIVYEGRGVAYSEDVPYEMGPGDCLATGKGWHHDFPIVHEFVCALGVETEGSGQNRPGHLCEQRHGKAIPEKDRI